MSTSPAAASPNSRWRARADGKAEQHGVRLSSRDERFERRLVDVVLELLLTEGDVDDLVHSLEAHVELGRVARDHRDRHRPTELPRRRHELASELAQLAT